MTARYDERQRALYGYGPSNTYRLSPDLRLLRQVPQPGRFWPDARVRGEVGLCQFLAFVIACEVAVFVWAVWFR